MTFAMRHFHILALHWTPLGKTGGAAFHKRAPWVSWGIVAVGVLLRCSAGDAMRSVDTGEVTSSPAVNPAKQTLL